MGDKQGIATRTRAVLLCKDQSFWEFLNATHYSGIKSIEGAIECIYKYCDIESRGELAYNKYAQDTFRDLDRQYMKWSNPVDEQYADNLSREY